MDGSLGEIRIFAGNFAPRHWALCQGQLLAINQNQSLYSILGTTYGGDGRTSFALPDLRGRIPVGNGAGAGLPTVTLGQKFGTEHNNLTTAQLPAHNHLATIGGHLAPAANTGSPNDSDAPSGAYFQVAAEDSYSESPTTNLGALEANLTANIALAGASQAMENRQPILTINFIVCLQGTFPSRN